MEQVLLVFDPALDVDVAAVAAAWAADAEAEGLLAGEPVVRRDETTTFHLDLVELVVIPLAVNVASTVLIDITQRLVRKVRGTGDAVATVERAPGGEQVIVVTGQSADQIDS